LALILLQSYAIITPLLSYALRDGFAAADGCVMLPLPFDEIRGHDARYLARHGAIITWMARLY